MPADSAKGWKPAAAIRGIVAALAALNTVISRVALWLATAIIAFAAIALMLGAFERQWGALHIPAINDLPPMLMPWMVFLLVGSMLRRGGHITVDVLDQKLDGRSRRVVDFIVHLAILVIGGAFLFGGIEALRFFIDLGEMSDSDIQFPIWWVYLAFPVGFALVVLVSLEGLLRTAAGIEAPADQTPAGEA
jgi:TRAP-type C4-dicarboxylate transport system permease small subunit